jgi:hypothetical protein
MYSIINSDFLRWQNELKYYNDMSKFAKLGTWILNSLGAEIDNLEDLIGDMPTLETKRELTEEDQEIIEMCEANNLNYKITSTGIKVST